MISKQKSIYREDGKAVSEEKLWSRSHPPHFQIPYPSGNINKEQHLEFWFSSEKGLNGFATRHGRATWVTNSTPHLSLPPSCPSSFKGLPLSRSNSDFPTTHSSSLIAWIQENKCNREIYQGLKCCLLAKVRFTVSREKMLKSMSNTVLGTVSVKQSPILKWKKWLSSDQIIRR